uniref:Uncharacterized protein n=1 Tax=Promethearchaeum syntrophicum TaxID=2594042 RepID=A0A5B9DA85_9ARCH|nr:hypothetical protein DSAG12_01882 [Candidatus Prometheoarchaeum syntrophicum]
MQFQGLKNTIFKRRALIFIFLSIINSNRGFNYEFTVLSDFTEV